MKIKKKYLSILFISVIILLPGCSNTDIPDDFNIQPQDELTAAEFNQENITKEPQTNQAENQENENETRSSDSQKTLQTPEANNLSEEKQTISNQGDTVTEQNVAIEQPPVDSTKGFTAPEFSLSTISGSNITLSELRGKNVVLNYWKSWCIPCMEELIALENLHRTYQGENLVILSVNGIEDDNLEDVSTTIQEKGLTYPVILDHGEIFWKSYQVLFLPTSFFIDEQGVIRDIAIGGDSEADFKLRIDQLLADEL
jgi:peroxiredoxin